MHVDSLRQQLSRRVVGCLVGHVRSGIVHDLIIESLITDRGIYWHTPEMNSRLFRNELRQTDFRTAVNRIPNGEPSSTSARARAGGITEAPRVAVVRRCRSDAGAMGRCAAAWPGRPAHSHTCRDLLYETVVGDLPCQLNGRRRVRRDDANVSRHSSCVG